jgi:hypothetical protein
MMRDKQLLPNTDNGDTALHSGTFIAANSHAPTCDTLRLKCTACLFAKPQLELLQIKLPNPHVRIALQMETICHVETAYQPTIFSLLFKSNMVTHVVANLSIMEIDFFNFP